MQNEGYKQALNSDPNFGRYLLYLPPSCESKLINISYTLQVFISFSGLTLPNKKPIEEVTIDFQLDRDLFHQK